MENKLSIIVLTHNDEGNLVDCLESLAFGNELIIVDDNSTDRTVQLAKNYTKNVFVRSMNGNFSDQRNFALNQARFEWVLFIDSDEIVSEKMKKEVEESIKIKGINGYYIKRFDYVWGKRILHGEVGTVRLLRLAKRNAGRWHGKVHETWKIKGTTPELVAPLVHVPHQSVREFLADIDNYSTLRANDLFESKNNSNLFSIVAYPTAKFFINYFIKKGYKDGIPGFIYACMMSMHSFMVRSKLYLLREHG